MRGRLPAVGLDCEISLGRRGRTSDMSRMSWVMVGSSEGVSGGSLPFVSLETVSLARFTRVCMTWDANRCFDRIS